MKFAKWLFFGVCLTLAPFVADYLILSNHAAPGVSPEMKELFGKGELLLVVAAISAAAIGEIIGAGKSRLLLKFIAVVGCLFILGAASELYASTVSDVRSHIAYNVDNLVRNSYVLFLLTIAAGGGCVLLGD
jgi:hypothetical protein